MAEYEKNRVHLLLLYPDNIDHSVALLKIMKPDFPYDYVGILHDQDKKEDGQDAKPHYHIVLYFKSPRSELAVSKELGIEERFCRAFDDQGKPYKRDDSVKYIFHYGYPDKHQYEVSDGFGNLLPLAEKLCSEKLSEASQVMLILRIMDSLPRNATYRKFLEEVCKADLYSAFRRMGSNASRLFDEHLSREFYDYHLQK